MACISRSKWGACGTVPQDSTKKDEIAIHHSVAPTVEARREARRLIELLKGKGAQHLGGHQEFPNQATACPGDELLDYVKKWRDDFDLSGPEPS
jgi:hypothetical protein